MNEMMTLSFKLRSVLNVTQINATNILVKIGILSQEPNNILLLRRVAWRLK